MAPHLDRVQGEYNGRVALQKINADTAPELVRSLGVMGVPTVIALRDGREISRRTGFQSDADLRLLFDAALTAAPGTRLAGPTQLDRMLRIVTGFALLLLAVFTGWPWLLVAAAAIVLFSAVHDRCPLWQAVRSRFLPPKSTTGVAASEKVT
jgi:thiol-disulfide isomerase/thioredoxin